MSPPVCVEISAWLTVPPPPCYSAHMEKICADCREPFETSKRRRYCSGCGSNAARSFRRRQRRNPTLIWRRRLVNPACRICGELLPKRSRVFCGKWCSSRALAQCKMSREQYLAAYRACSGRCQLCGKHKKRLNIDHDHTTGEFRGLLCHPCNTGLGKLGDTEAKLRAACTYLATSRGRLVERNES